MADSRGFGRGSREGRDLHHYTDQPYRMCSSLKTGVKQSNIFPMFLQLAPCQTALVQDRLFWGSYWFRKGGCSLFFP